LSLKTTRAKIFNTKTVMVINKAPAQANRTQLSYGLIANWKITTGKLAIGAPIFVLKNWLFKAVKSNGAVSPLMRAIANNMPVITPLFAARKVTMVETFQRGAPNAKAASRKLPGTKRSMFSVVRITTGIAIKDKAKLPA
jgi:hypothetical protein